MPTAKLKSAASEVSKLVPNPAVPESPKPRSYGRDFAAGLDPTGTRSFQYGVEDVGKPAGERRLRRAIQTVGGTIGGLTLVPAAAGAVIGGALNVGGGPKGILHGMASGAHAPFTGLRNLLSARNTLGKISKGELTTERELKLLGDVIENMGAEPISTLVRTSSPEQLVRLRRGHLGRSQRVTDEIENLRWALGAQASQHAGALGLAGGIGGVSAHSQYGKAQELGKHMTQEQRDAATGKNKEAFYLGGIDELEKIAARAGLKLLRKMLLSGKEVTPAMEAAAGRLAKAKATTGGGKLVFHGTPAERLARLRAEGRGVSREALSRSTASQASAIKPSAQGSQLAHTRREMLASGMHKSLAPDEMGARIIRRKARREAEGQMLEAAQRDIMATNPQLAMKDPAAFQDEVLNLYKKRIQYTKEPTLAGRKAVREARREMTQPMGAEGLATRVADPELGLPVRKLYDPNSNIASEAMISRRMELARDVPGGAIAHAQAHRVAPSGAEMTFHKFIKGRKPTDQEMAQLLKEGPLAKTMQQAESKGWTLGDVRPANVRITPEGKPVIIDTLPFREGEFAGMGGARGNVIRTTPKGDWLLGMGTEQGSGLKAMKQMAGKTPPPGLPPPVPSAKQLPPAPKVPGAQPPGTPGLTPVGSAKGTSKQRPGGQRSSAVEVPMPAQPEMKQFYKRLKANKPPPAPSLPQQGATGKSRPRARSLG